MQYLTLCSLHIGKGLSVSTPQKIIISPQPGPQTQFLKSNADIVFMGGGAGGSKTYSLLLDCLYNINNPQYGAVIFRRTTKQITKQGSLWDTANELYTQLGAKPLQSPHHHFVFNTGAKINLHHMEHEKDRFDWQGSQIPDVKFDEVTHFTWMQFNYMFSRLRSMSGIPGRIRATCNPDPDHWLRSFIDWWIGEDGFPIPERSGVIRYVVIVGDEIVWADNPQILKDKYPNSLPKSCTFIKSSVFDNKILLERDPAYLSNLHALTRVERARLLDGNWNIRATAGSFFRRGEFEVVDAAPAEAKKVRAWDLAATKRKETSKQKERKSSDPDWTAGALLSVHNGIYYIEHIERFREEARKVEQIVKNIALHDGNVVKVRIPQDPGQAGKAQAKAYISALAGFDVVTYPVTGDKEHRATPFAAQVQAGNVKIVKGKWNESFLLEAENFPDGIHDDQVDAVSDAFDELTNKNRRAGTW